MAGKHMYVPIHVDLPRHPRVVKFCRELGVEKTAAIGVLVNLWIWVTEYFSSGIIQVKDPADIADACMWKGEPNTLLSALGNSGLLESRPDGYSVHDWQDYSGAITVKRKPPKKLPIQENFLTDMDAVVLEFPMLHGDSYLLRQSKLQEYQESYPKIDVLAECKKARQWIIDNPRRKKSNVPMFLTNWLNRRVDTSVPNNSPVSNRYRGTEQYINSDEYRQHLIDSNVLG